MFLVAVLLVTACTDESPTASPSTSSSTSTGAHDDAAKVEEDHSDFGVLLVDQADFQGALTPIDHKSSVDSQLLEAYIAQIGEQDFRFCIAHEGYENLVPPLVELSHDSPYLLAHFQFPNVELLKTEGLVLPPPALAWPEPSQLPAGLLQTMQACDLRRKAAYPERQLALERYGEIRSAWEWVLRDLDSHESLAPQQQAFSQCLVAAGVPSTAAQSQSSFLGYLGSLRRDSPNEQADTNLRLEYGRLYASCGEDLFLKLETLRSDRRPDFLTEHETLIQELLELIND